MIKKKTFIKEYSSTPMKEQKVSRDLYYLENIRLNRKGSKRFTL